MDIYTNEAKQRYGETEAYKEYKEKTVNYTKGKWKQVNNGLDLFFVKFSECLKNNLPADAKEAQTLVEELKNYISENYYTCTNQILAGLGEMYVYDERFKSNIDKHCSGTAEFVCEAIMEYCRKN